MLWYMIQEFCFDRLISRVRNQSRLETQNRGGDERGKEGVEGGGDWEGAGGGIGGLGDKGAERNSGGGQVKQSPIVGVHIRGMDGDCR